MKKSTLAIVVALVALGGPALGREISKAEGSSLSVKTLTEFGYDFDHPERFGLKFSVPELSLTYDLFGYQKLTNRIKSDNPIGFLDLTLGEVQIRFTNQSQPDYNNPGQNMQFGFNDSASGATGFFSPLYLQNVRSGILWGDWILQLGTGGTDAFWDPWHRESVGYGTVASSWAYLDTRVQYQRPLIPAVINAIKEEGVYWAYDDQAKSASTGVDELADSFEGAAIGLQYSSTEFSTMMKLGTQYAWDSPKLTAVGAKNGLAAGLDSAWTPTSMKGFRILGSLVGGINQADRTYKSSVSAGLKAGYDYPLPKSGSKISSIEPYVGVDVFQPIAVLGSASGPTGIEASTGLTLHWPGMNGWGFDYLQGPDGRTGNVYSGATLAYKVYLPNLSSGVPKHSAQLTWYNDEDGGLLNNVGSELALQWIDFMALNSTLELTSYFDVSLNNTLGGVLVPWTKIYFDHFKTASMASRENNLKIDGGFKLKKAIRNVEFGLTYQSRNLFASSGNSSLTDGLGAFGIVKCSVQVSL